MIQIDSRIYDDIFLLAKILEKTELSKDEKARVYKRFERSNVRKWIPVSEMLPKNDDWVIVTILDEWGDTPWTYTDFGWYLEAASCWIIDSNQRTDVIAWMPLPEPWKGADNDK